MTIGQETEKAATQFVESSEILSGLISDHQAIEERIRSTEGMINKSRMLLKKRVTPGSKLAAFAIGKKTVVIKWTDKDKTTVDIVEPYVLAASKNGKPDEGKSDD